jgi:hypothetical protein
MQTEPDFLGVEDVEQTIRKPQPQSGGLSLGRNKPIREAQLQHLANIRVKALDKKKEMKIITEKANKVKEYETLKAAKQLQKQEMAKHYDNMMKENEPKIVEPKVEAKVEEPKPEPKVEEPKEKPKAEPKQKKKVIKKVIYQEASSSDSDGADEVEIVKVKKQSKKPPPQPKPEPITYSNLIYESSIDKLKSRMMDERAKHLVSSLMPQYN